MNEVFVRVPYYVEKDGSKTFFLPNCRMKGGYRLGAKGEELLVENYWDALARVEVLVPPRFRRPNSEGNFGVVTCELGAFEEVRRDFIELERGKYGG